MSISLLNLYCWQCIFNFVYTEAWQCPPLCFSWHSSLLMHEVFVRRRLEQDTACHGTVGNWFLMTVDFVTPWQCHLITRLWRRQFQGRHLMPHEFNVRSFAHRVQATNINCCCRCAAIVGTNESEIRLFAEWYPYRNHLGNLIFFTVFNHH